VIWIELFLLGKQVSSDVLLITYLQLFIHHKHHVTLMHTWYSSSAHTCNRCTEGRDLARIRRDEPESFRGAAAWTRSSGGAATGEVADKVVVDCPDHVPCNFVKGKPRSIISLPPSEMQLSIMLYIIALSDRCWMKPLVAYVPYPCTESTLWILFSSGSSSHLALL
jgi:hypothetical protein